MSTLTPLLDKLLVKDEKSLLIQGLPSSIEKQFAKLSYAKNVTPLLKSRKVDFVLIFAINSGQLINIMKDVMPALHTNSKVWISFPKPTSKIVSNLNREANWEPFLQLGFETVEQVELDHMWVATRFKRNEELAVADAIEIAAKIAPVEQKLVVAPLELEKIFAKHIKAKEIFSALPIHNQKEYVQWIVNAKRYDTKQKRLDTVVEKLMSGKKTPLEK